MQAAAAGTAGITLGARPLIAAESTGQAKPALLGGEPMHTGGYPSWPQIEDNDRQLVAEALEARGWCRLGGKYVGEFEEKFRELLGAKYCLAVSSGTSSLIASMNALDIGPGDEVLVPPYTFVATINIVLMQHALPILIDSDRQSFQMDAGKIEDAITENTRCILPVHLGGLPADLDTILALGKKHNIPVVEDACQAHLAEWHGKKVGTWGATGCFSFQVSKNLSSGEGGVVATNDEELMGKLYPFHTAGSPWGKFTDEKYARSATNIRMTEFQGALLCAQLSRLEAQSKIRSDNGDYLNQRLEAIPGIHPAKMYPGGTRNAYHLYMFRFDSEAFDGMTRARFMQALNAEGVPCYGGYGPMTKAAYIKNTVNSRGFLRVYGEKRIKEYCEQLSCPENDRLCEEAVWFGQNMLLGSREEMDQIADAIEKIHKHAGELKA